MKFRYEVSSSLLPSLPIVAGSGRGLASVAYLFTFDVDVFETS